MSSMSQPGAPVDSSAPMRKRNCTALPAKPAPRFTVVLTKFGQPAFRTTNARRLAPIGADVSALVEPLYTPGTNSSTSFQPEPSLTSITPPSQLPPSNAKRCRNERDRLPAPTWNIGEVRICSSGAKSLVSSFCPLLSGPHQTWSRGASVRRCQGAMFGEFGASPATVQAPTEPSEDSVADEAAFSSKFTRCVEVTLNGPGRASSGASIAILNSTLSIPTAPLSATSIEPVLSRYPWTGGKFMTLPRGNVTCGLLEVIVTSTRLTVRRPWFFSVMFSSPFSSLSRTS